MTVVTVLLPDMMSAIRWLTVVDGFCGLPSSNYPYQILIPNPDSTTNYRFALLSTGLGHIDLWSTTNVNLNYIDTVVPSPVDFPAIVNYRQPDKRKTIVSSWACSPNVITVGNFQGYNQYVDSQGTLWTETIPAGSISKNSSKGPTRNYLTKPDIAATGDHTLSAGSIATLTWYQTNAPDYLAQGGMHVMNGGTSMASPVVAGAAALLLQKCPSLTPSDVRQLLSESARQDFFTGNVPNDTFGYGKIDVYRSLIGTNFSPSVLGDTVICMPGSIDITADAAYPYTVWFDTDTLTTLTISERDTLWYQATDQRGCKAWSDTLIVGEFVVPTGEILLSATPPIHEALPANANNYTWYDAPGANVLQNGTSNLYDPTVSSFFCVITFDNGCETTTPTVFTTSIVTQANSLQMYPNPVGDYFQINSSEPIDRVFMYSSEGKLIKEWLGAENYNLDGAISNGLYMLQIKLGEKLLYTKVLIQR
jgi:hypothetical protein